MKWLKQLFGSSKPSAGDARTEPISSKSRVPEALADEPSHARHPQHDELLEKRFGLKFKGNGRWSFEGPLVEQFSAELGDPQFCMMVLNGIRQKYRFDQICVLAGNPVLIVCNSTPPIGLTAARYGAAELIVSIIKANGKPIVEVDCGFLCQMPSS